MSNIQDGGNDDSPAVPPGFLEEKPVELPPDEPKEGDVRPPAETPPIDPPAEIPPMEAPQELPPPDERPKAWTASTIYAKVNMISSV